MGKEYREQMIDEFTSEKKWILITTDLLARGIDFPKVKLVINFDIPESMVTYVHRVGRSGRAGYVGRAITFFTSEDKVTVRLLADLLKSSVLLIPQILGVCCSRMDFQDKEAIKEGDIESEKAGSSTRVNLK